MSAHKPLPKLLLTLPWLLGGILAMLYWRGMTLNPNAEVSRLIGKPLPDVALPQLFDANQSITTQQLRGPALVNVWASWCSACRNEHALLHKMVKEDSVVIYGIDYQDNLDAAKVLLAERGNPYALVLFDGASLISMAFDIISLPQTYVIDTHGKVLYRHVGELTEQQRLEIRTLLNDDVNTPSS